MNFHEADSHTCAHARNPVRGLHIPERLPNEEGEMTDDKRAGTDTTHFVFPSANQLSFFF